MCCCFALLVLCLAIRLFNLIESQTWWNNSWIDHFAHSWINSKVNGNHEITTQKQKKKIFSPLPGFEPCCQSYLLLYLLLKLVLLQVFASLKIPCSWGSDVDKIMSVTPLQLVGSRGGLVVELEHSLPNSSWKYTLLRWVWIQHEVKNNYLWIIRNELSGCKHIWTRSYSE